MAVCEIFFSTIHSRRALESGGCVSRSASGQITGSANSAVVHHDAAIGVRGGADEGRAFATHLLRMTGRSVSNKLIGERDASIAGFA
ncbi:hypothetical protein [Paraburkholderia fynbosensis]|uniref:hypothetical protein n=1 Tax=Paraburkholderia fynbosensis TaxID=1200993 RepID=UPI001582D5B1|nr:hypothetical protein [Paraburkholderia fynbosensis]